MPANAAQSVVVDGTNYHLLITWHPLCEMLLLRQHQTLWIIVSQTDSHTIIRATQVASFTHTNAPIIAPSRLTRVRLQWRVFIFHYILNTKENPWFTMWSGEMNNVSLQRVRRCLWILSLTQGIAPWMSRQSKMSGICYIGSSYTGFLLSVTLQIVNVNWWKVKLV